MIAIAALMLVFCLLIPMFFIWRLWRMNEPTRLGWLLVLMESSMLVALVMLLGRWDMAGMWTRLILIGLAIAAALASARRHASRPWIVEDRQALWRSLGPTVASLLLSSAALVYVVIGMTGQQTGYDLAFPLKEGHFVIAHGGGISLLNHHSGHPAQAHALDIVAVNAAGLRASGLIPKDPARYVVFGKTVISPCDGLVIAAVDGLADQTPPTADRAIPAGNHVILSCNGLHIELAHLRQGSVWPKTGEQVRTGAIIGLVGNSGNSTEPHLHIHATDAQTGEAAKLAFDGRNPLRNTQFVR